MEKSFRVRALPAMSSALASNPQRTTRATVALIRSMPSARCNNLSNGGFRKILYERGGKRSDALYVSLYLKRAALVAR